MTKVPLEIDLELDPVVMFAMAADKDLAGEFKEVVQGIASEEIIREATAKLRQRVQLWVDENRDRIERAAITVTVEQ